MTSNPHGVVHIGSAHLMTLTGEQRAARIAETAADWERSGYQVTPVPPSSVGEGHVFDEPCPACKPTT